MIRNRALRTALERGSQALLFGQVGGGHFNVTMKSGTNSYHGSGYEYFVNEALNAGTPFTNDGNGHPERNRQRRNDFWGVLPTNRRTTPRPAEKRPDASSAIATEMLQGIRYQRVHGTAEISAGTGSCFCFPLFDSPLGAE
jgi:hypothetical protein